MSGTYISQVKKHLFWIFYPLIYGGGENKQLFHRITTVLRVQTINTVLILSYHCLLCLDHQPPIVQELPFTHPQTYLDFLSKYPMSCSDSIALEKTVCTLIVLPLSRSATANVLIHSLFPQPAGPTTNICKKMKTQDIFQFCNFY